MISHHRFYRKILYRWSSESVNFSATVTSLQELKKRHIAGTIYNINMVLKRSNRSVFGRVIFWTLFVSAGIIIIFNMVFVLQTATELAILKNAGQDKTTFPSFSDEKRAQYEPTSVGKVFQFTFTLSFHRIKIAFSGPFSSCQLISFKWMFQEFGVTSAYLLRGYTVCNFLREIQYRFGCDVGNQRVWWGKFVAKLETN